MSLNHLQIKHVNSYATSVIGSVAELAKTPKNSNFMDRE